nr:ATP-binding cassette domain-containing protein [Aeromicrobium senzhongii]
MVPVISADSLFVVTEGLFLLTMCYAWNLVGGFLGELSFAHMLFWAIGGYGVLYWINDGNSVVTGFLIYAAVAMVAGVIVALLIKASGLKGLLPISIFTLVLGQIAYTYAIGSEDLGGVEGVSALSLPAWSDEAMYLVLVAIAAFTAIVNLTVSNTRLGSSWLAIRDDQVAAHVAGINVTRHRLLAYAISAALFAVGGAFQAYYAGYALPAVTLNIHPLLLVTLAVFIGGTGSAMGPLIGTLIIFGLQAVAQQFSTSAEVSLYAQLAEFAIALVLLRVVLPKLGGLDLMTALIRRLRKVGRRRGDDDDVRVTGSDVSLATALLDRSADDAGAPGELVLRNVKKSFGRLEVLKDVNFVVRPGEVLGIVGPNGAGKSTLCNLISGVEPVTAGEISLGETDLTTIPARKRTDFGIGRSFQTPRLFESLSLTKNLALAARGVGESTAKNALAALGVTDAHLRRGDDSQFFARRLTEVVKASSQGTAVLLLDEPLAGLTSDEHESVLALARDAANAGACVIIVEHLIPVLAPAVDRIVALADGRVIADGPPMEVLQDEAVVEAYLGTPHVEEAE